MFIRNTVSISCLVEYLPTIQGFTIKIFHSRFHLDKDRLTASLVLEVSVKILMQTILEGMLLSQTRVTRTVYLTVKA